MLHTIIRVWWFRIPRKERRGLNSPCMIMQQTDVSRGLELSKKSHQLNLNESRRLLRREVEQKWTANNKVVGWDDERKNASSA